MKLINEWLRLLSGPGWSSRSWSHLGPPPGSPAAHYFVQQHWLSFVLSLGPAIRKRPPRIWAQAAGFKLLGVAEGQARDSSPASIALRQKTCRDSPAVQAAQPHLHLPNISWSTLVQDMPSLLHFPSRHLTLAKAPWLASLSPTPSQQAVWGVLARS